MPLQTKRNAANKKRNAVNKKATTDVDYWGLFLPRHRCEKKKKKKYKKKNKQEQEYPGKRTRK